jgi:hypothetical protein
MVSTSCFSKKEEIQKYKRRGQLDKNDLILQESEKAFCSEAGRRERLTGKAEKYIGAVAVVIGFRLIELHPKTTLANIQGEYYLIFSIFSFLLLGASLILSLLGMQVKGYVSYPRGTELIDKLEGDSISDDEAKKAIASMYLRAHETNARLNDKKAKHLSYGGMLLVIGFLIAIMSYLIGKGIITF